MGQVSGLLYIENINLKLREPAELLNGIRYQGKEDQLECMLEDLSMVILETDQDSSEMAQEHLDFFIQSRQSLEQIKKQVEKSFKNIALRNANYPSNFKYFAKQNNLIDNEDANKTDANNSNRSIINLSSPFLNEIVRIGFDLREATKNKIFFSRKTLSFLNYFLNQQSLISSSDILKVNPNISRFTYEQILEIDIYIGKKRNLKDLLRAFFSYIASLENDLKNNDNDEWFLEFNERWKTEDIILKQSNAIEPRLPYILHEGASFAERNASYFQSLFLYRQGDRDFMKFDDPYIPKEKITLELLELIKRLNPENADFIFIWNKDQGQESGTIADTDMEELKKSRLTASPQYHPLETSIKIAERRKIRAVKSHNNSDPSSDKMLGGYEVVLDKINNLVLRDIKKTNNTVGEIQINLKFLEKISHLECRIRAAAYLKFFKMLIEQSYYLREAYVFITFHHSTNLSITILGQIKVVEEAFQEFLQIFDKKHEFSDNFKLNSFDINYLNNSIFLELDDLLSFDYNNNASELRINEFDRIFAGFKNNFPIKLEASANTFIFSSNIGRNIVNDLVDKLTPLESSSVAPLNIDSQKFMKKVQNSSQELFELIEYLIIFDDSNFGAKDFIPVIRAIYHRYMLLENNLEEDKSYFAFFQSKEDKVIGIGNTPALSKPLQEPSLENFNLAQQNLLEVLSGHKKHSEFFNLLELLSSFNFQGTLMELISQIRRVDFEQFKDYWDKSEIKIQHTNNNEVEIPEIWDRVFPDKHFSNLPSTNRTIEAARKTLKALHQIISFRLDIKGIQQDGEDVWNEVSRQRLPALKTGTDEYRFFQTFKQVRATKVKESAFSYNEEIKFLSDCFALYRLLESELKDLNTKFNDESDYKQKTAILPKNDSDLFEALKKRDTDDFNDPLLFRYLQALHFAKKFGENNEVLKRLGQSVYNQIGNLLRFDADSKTLTQRFKSGECQLCRVHSDDIVEPEVQWQGDAVEYPDRALFLNRCVPKERQYCETCKDCFNVYLRHYLISQKGTQHPSIPIIDSLSNDNYSTASLQSFLYKGYLNRENMLLLLELSIAAQLDQNFILCPNGRNSANPYAICGSVLSKAALVQKMTGKEQKEAAVQFRKMSKNKAQAKKQSEQKNETMVKLDWITCPTCLLPVCGTCEAGYLANSSCHSTQPITLPPDSTCISCPCCGQLVEKTGGCDFIICPNTRCKAPFDITNGNLWTLEYSRKEKGGSHQHEVASRTHQAKWLEKTGKDAKASSTSSKK